MVEQRIRNAKVAGSTPVTGTSKINKLFIAFIPGTPQISFCVLVGVLVWQDINPVYCFYFAYDSVLIFIDTSVIACAKEKKLGLYDRINSQIEKSQNIHSRFISLRDIYIHLKNHRPEASSQDILQAFDAEYRTLDQKPELYTWDGNSMNPVGAYVQFGSKPTSFEDLGKNLPITLARVVAQIKDDPINHQSAKIYGFDRCELNMAMDTDFPEAPCELRDYEAELTQLRVEIEGLRAENAVLKTSKKDPSPSAEIFAERREDVLSAMIAVLFHPDVYIDEKQLQRVKFPGLTISKLVEIVEAALPEQRQLVSIVNKKSPLFWSDDGEPPLEDSIMLKHLSKAVNRIPD